MSLTLDEIEKDGKLRTIFIETLFILTKSLFLLFFFSVSEAFYPVQL